MTPIMKALGIDRLSIEDRLQLMDEIWESISTDQLNMPLPESQRQDLERRLKAYQADPQGGASWEEVKGRLMG